jgi:hypothetical protein
MNCLCSYSRGRFLFVLVTYCVFVLGWDIRCSLVDAHVSTNIKALAQLEQNLIDIFTH